MIYAREDKEICSYELSLLLAVAKGKKRKSDSGMEVCFILFHMVPWHTF
jgi:hypothetical protein